MSTGRWKWTFDPKKGSYLEFVTSLPYVIKFYPKTYDISLKPDALLLKQVHSNTIHTLINIDAKIRNRPDGDGWFVRTPNLNVGIQVADCLPVAMLSESKKGFFLLHCGWRSIKNSIIEKSLSLAKYADITPHDLHIVVGPCIRGCHYEVGPELKKIFPNHITYREHKFFLDLFSILFSILRESGVPTKQIVEPPYCTFEHSSLFWSYRREGNSKKSMMMTTKMLP